MDNWTKFYNRTFLIQNIIGLQSQMSLVSKDDYKEDYNCFDRNY